MKAAGFTLVELAVTIVVLGIIAAVAVPRFASRNTFESRGFYDRATATVRYAQKVAIAQRRTVLQPIVVTITANSITVCCLNPNGTGGPVIEPGTGAALAVTAPPTSGVTLSPTVFSFSGSGRPSAAQNITLTSSVGDPARFIVVDNETGYVHPGP